MSAAVTLKVRNGQVHIGPHSVDYQEAQYESFCDNLLMGISRETLVGWFGEINVERFEKRYRQERM